MAWMQEINVYDHGVRLPTGGHWVDLPNSPFQIMARDTDILGVVHIRIAPAYAHREKCWWPCGFLDRADCNEDPPTVVTYNAA